MNRALGFAAAVLCLAALSGCYENVVAAKGFGSDKTAVAKPNLPRDGERLSGYKKFEHKPIP